MTIENYFERRIRPIIEDTKETGNIGTIDNTGCTGNTGNVENYYNNSNKQNNSLIDEDQLARTFQEIVNCINLDDEDEDSDNEKPSLTSINFSRSNFHNSHHSLLPEFNSIFGGSSSSFNIAVGSGENKTKTTSNNSLGKSFLDDVWFPINKSNSEDINSTLRSTTTVNAINTTTATTAAATAINATNAIASINGNRPMTPNSTISSSFNHRNSSEYFLRDGNSYNNLPPNDYICKLCNCDGHWMKDCRLYEPRNSPSSISSFKSTSSSNNFNFPSSTSGVSIGNRTLLPPGNYVCRLCNVSGHWIDQCSKFQPKNEPSINNNSNTSSSPVLPPMLGPGPTPNYRPPAYLSKPVPSNYICNLCNRPGHWIQQCTEFTPIINHKPHSINKY